MESVLWYVVPLGIAMAFSLLPILAAVLLLLSRRPVSSSISYVAGWALGVLVLVAVFALAASFVPTGRIGVAPGWMHWVELALGVALVIWGAATLRRPAQNAGAPAWAESLKSVAPRRAFVFGLIMNLRPKNLALVVAAGLAIGSGSLDPPSAAVAILVFTLLGVSVVAVLVIAYLLGASRLQPSLERLGDWLIAHAGIVVRVTLILVGVLLIVLGVEHLIFAT